MCAEKDLKILKPAELFCEYYCRKRNTEMQSVSAVSVYLLYLVVSGGLRFPLAYQQRYGSV